MKDKKIQKQKGTFKKASPLRSIPDKTENWKIYLALAIILVISALIYLPVLDNNLLAWDDDGYIKDNPLVYTINLKEIFSQYIMGNYHPLTILTLAIEYKFFGLDPVGYHTVNLLLHVLNVVLVFYAIFLLSEKNSVALIAAFLFGVHPLHVESVAWAAELKDLLYTFFFLASWIFYMKYLKEFQKKFIVLALLLFLLSLLSKAMAASLPAVLILTDYFKGRKINLKSLLDKVPFFILAIILGIVAVMAQKSSDAIQDIATYSFFQRIVFACYGFISYLIKLVLPTNLMAYYPYPVGGNIPIQFYSYTLILLLLFGSVFYSLRFSKKIFFGIGFFAVTVFLVLQLLPVGGAIMADRYSYIPSIGIFYLAGEGFNLLWNRKMKGISLALLSAFTVFFSVKTYAISKVWFNDLSLWNDVIEKNQTVSKAYYNRGTFYLKDNKVQQALDDYKKTLEITPNYTEAYVNRGNILRDNKRIEEALTDYNKAVEIKPNFAIAYFNRGTLFMNEKRNEEAMKDFDKAIELKPSYHQAYHNRGNVFTNEKKYEEAINNYSKAIELKADYSISYYGRGVAQYYTGKKDAACSDMKKAAELGYKIPADILNQFCK